MLKLWGWVLTPKNTKKPKKNKPIYQFWCSDWFLCFFFFFLVFLVFFLVFFGLFLDFLRWHSNPKIKCPKNQFLILNVGQSLSQKNQKKPKKKTKKPVSNFELWPKPMPKNQKKKKNQFQFGNFKKPKKKKKKPKTKKTMPIYRFWCSDWFFWVSTPNCTNP